MSGAVGWSQSAGQVARFRSAHLPPPTVQEILSEIWAGAVEWPQFASQEDRFR
jgi:hypothetical protein